MANEKQIQETIKNMKKKALDYKLDKIKREAGYLISAAKRVLEKANSEDPHFNSLGELQGNALRLDHAIIEFSNIKATFEDVEVAIKEVA